MTVTVAWPVGKQRGDNLEPQFRPTGSNRLEGKETTIARLVYEAYTLMDPAWNASLALGRITEATYQKRIETALESLSGALQRILYEAHQVEMAEMAGRIRESINRDLRRLGSPVRLVATGEARKAANVYVEWAGKAVTTFDAAVPGSTSLVYAQFRTGQIVTYMGTEQVDMIRDQIAQAFTQVQQWGGGRITTGLTPQQVSSNLFTLLAQTTPAQMELTAAQVAAYRSGYTNGLFPAWAKAVNNYGDRTATQLDKQGITGDRARTLLDKRTQRYGDKLRRARSRMIARTEIAKVQNAAMQATIDSAYSDGLVGNRAQKVWVTGPFDVCNICQPLSGRRVPYNGYFQWKNGSGPHGPAHPNCRCIIRMVPNTSRPPKHMGAGTPADPFRYQFADGWTAPVTPVRGVPRLPGVRAPKVPKVPPLPTPPPTVPESMSSAARAYQQGGDEGTEALFEHLGFSGKPRVVSADELAAAVEQSPAGELRRVVSSATRYDEATDSLVVVEPSEVAESFRRGKHFIGDGSRGRGTYTIEGTAAEFESYAARVIPRTAEHGEVLEMTLAPDARIYEMTNWVKESLKLEADYAHLGFGDDAHAILASLGYDAVRYPTTRETMMVVFNRTKVVVGA